LKIIVFMFIFRCSTPIIKERVISDLKLRLPREIDVSSRVP